MIIKQSQINDVVSKLKAQNKKIVTTNGCFDILHVGHVRYLQKAKSYGDVLIIAVNSDNSVKKIKGNSRPINNQNDRLEVLDALKSVDFVVLFEETSPINLILQIKPDIHTKGGDYTIETLPEAKKILEIGTKIEFIPFVNGKSTTAVIEKMKNN